MMEANDDKENNVFAATCATCGVYQLLWLGLVTDLTTTPAGYHLCFTCPRCGAQNSRDFRQEARKPSPDSRNVSSPLADAADALDAAEAVLLSPPLCSSGA